MNCLVCEVCAHSEPDASMLVCDACERGYHTTCLRPPLPAVPDGRWLCADCVRCILCGGRSGPWTHDYTVCAACNNRGLHTCTSGTATQPYATTVPTCVSIWFMPRAGSCL